MRVLYRTRRVIEIIVDRRRADSDHRLDAQGLGH